ncbi:MAG: 23S rRNA methyltransferase [Betaproteobacteria bacterium RIFCSPLOWO2_02_FULL_67_19]|nr:MAG: 23S rRNA methyltransferase [Betaproteobacteria bacterium RIFCSPLOWO2_02_FULL_67_19]
MRSRSSQRWLQRHVTDPFVRRARESGRRSRAAFKLLEIDQRERLLRPGARVVDLGAAPGGWSQVAAERVRPGGVVVAVDLLEIAPISGVTVLRGDFRDAAVQAAVAEALGGSKADVVLSDLSPNLSGIASADQARAAELIHAAIEFCGRCLAPPGAFLAKVFQGEEFGGVLAALRASFREVRTRKPGASRDESRETYLLARGLKSPPA